MRRIVIDESSPLAGQLGPAVDAIRRGGVVAFPTDTLYGLAADPRDEDAMAALFALKRRAPERTVALVAANLAQAETLATLGTQGRLLARYFWPGPLTLVVPAAADLAGSVLSDEHLVGIRVPDHAVARALAELCGHPLTATSANRSGEPATSDPDEVVAQLPGLGLLVDAGRTEGGPPSTVVDASGSEVRLLREGALPWSRVLEFLRTPSRFA
jgi:L-threonylcarbamoyladenylate synthase